jgi:hypothetical protein
VDHEHVARPFGKPAYPSHEPGLVGMAADSLEFSHRRAHVDLLAEDGHPLGAPSRIERTQVTVGLVSAKDDRRLAFSRDCASDGA